MLKRCYEPLSPRKPQGLPYLQLNRVGRLSYVRRIPPDLQVFAGNQKVIRRSLGLSTTNQAYPVVIAAWNRVHQETEARLSKAKAAQAGELAAEPRATPLTPRDTAGIAAEPWRQILDAMNNGRLAPQSTTSALEVQSLLNRMLHKAPNELGLEELMQVRHQIAQLLLGPVLDSLEISPDSANLTRLENRLWSYAMDARSFLTVEEQEKLTGWHLGVSL